MEVSIDTTNFQIINEMVADNRGGLTSIPIKLRSSWDMCSCQSQTIKLKLSIRTLLTSP